MIHSATALINRYGELAEANGAATRSGFKTCQRVKVTLSSSRDGSDTEANTRHVCGLVGFQLATLMVYYLQI